MEKQAKGEREVRPPPCCPADARRDGWADAVSRLGCWCGRPRPCRCTTSSVTADYDTQQQRNDPLEGWAGALSVALSASVEQGASVQQGGPCQPRATHGLHPAWPGVALVFVTCSLYAFSLFVSLSRHERGTDTRQNPPVAFQA